jgi:AAA domain
MLRALWVGREICRPACYEFRMHRIRPSSGVANRPFVIVSGLPGSGKTTVAEALAPLLHLPVFDKDTILEQLFETRGIGDASWRRQLSREADDLLQAAVSSCAGAVVTSFWCVTGMPADYGTPTDWLGALSRTIVNVHCECPPQLATARFVRRTRHPGHLDETRTAAEVLATIQALPTPGYLGVGEPVIVETTATVTPALLLQDVEAAFARCRTRLAADDDQAP